jgi:hypothetical protein
MIKNGLKLMDMDEGGRAWREITFSAALTECVRRGCVMDIATSDVAVYLDYLDGSPASVEDCESVGRLMPGYRDGESYHVGSLEQF